jgi:hypothetical protein
MKTVAMLMVPLCLACSGEGEEIAALTRSAVARDGVNAVGLMCGLSYIKGSSRWVDGTCDGKHTLDLQLAQGFQQKFVGDSGLPAWSGFYYQFWNGPEAVFWESDILQLPQGTACGLKMGCYDFTMKCMDNDPSQSCPFGWDMKMASDFRSPAGCNFYWCQYKDPHGLCPNGNCPVHIPQGLTCGLTDNDAGSDHFREGTCLGRRTWNDDCPTGFQRFGFFDDGRPGGHGVGWCAKM